MTKKLRYELDPVKANITITRAVDNGGEEKMTLELDAGLRDVSRRLALMGLTQHVQRATTRDKDADPFEVIEAAYNDLKENGLLAFERKQTAVPGASRGPTKAQKIAALAVLYNTTPTVVREKLKDKTAEQVNAILSNEKVLAKVEEMQTADDISL
jgi:hypothetical protein